MTPEDTMTPEDMISYDIEERTMSQVYRLLIPRRHFGRAWDNWKTAQRAVYVPVDLAANRLHEVVRAEL